MLQFPMISVRLKFLRIYVLLIAYIATSTIHDQIQSTRLGVQAYLTNLLLVVEGRTVLTVGSDSIYLFKGRFLSCLFSIVSNPR